MAEGYTISVSQGDHAEEHSRRAYTPASADYSLREMNEVLFDAGDDKEHFNGFFRSAIEEYNSRQKRADRKKPLDYYSALLDGSEGYGKGKQQEKPIYDDVIQIGNRDTNGITKRTFDVDHWRKLKSEGKFDEASRYVKQNLNHDKEQQDLREVLLEVGQEILSESANSREYRKAHGLPPGKYDNILIHRLIAHADEPNGTLHLDMGYTIFTDDGNSTRKDGRQNGLSTRVSMTKGLAAMGFRTKKDSFALEQFRDSIKLRIQEKMEERGYQRDIKGEHRRHLSAGMYEIEQRAKEAQSEVDDLTEKKAGLETEISSLRAEGEEAKQAIDEAAEQKQQLEEQEQNISRKKKEQDERDKTLTKKADDLKTRQDFVIRWQRWLRQWLTKEIQGMNPDLLIDDEAEDHKGKKKKTIGELISDFETEFQKKEDALDAQKKAAEQSEAEAKAACAAFKKAGEITTEISQTPIPDPLMEFLKKQSYRVVGTTVEQRMKKDGTGWETVTVPKRGQDGKPVWETHNPLADYEVYLKGQERRRKLTEEEQQIIDRAKELSGEYGE